MATQWFYMAIEIYDAEVIKQGAGMCFLGLRWNVACRLPEKGCDHHGKVLHLHFLTN
jgi:hypothetical protein